jgi:hypothetical protein
MNKILAALLAVSLSVVIVLGLVLVKLMASKGKHMAMADATAQVSPPSGPSADSIRPASDPETADINLSFSIQGLEKVTVLQNAETDLDLIVVRHADYAVASASIGNTQSPSSLLLGGRFQGDVKLSSTIPKGGKGLTLTFDPETVKGSDDRGKLRIKADPDADLGDVDIKLTGTTSDGKTISTVVTLAVYKK